MRLFYILVVGLLFVQSQAQASWIVKSIVTGTSTKVISVQKKNQSLPEGMKHKNLRAIPQFVSEGHGDQKDLGGTYQEDLYADHALPKGLFEQFVDQPSGEPHSGLTAPEQAQSEVQTLVDQGPVGNRINLTIIGDGYTLAEKDRFFADARRMTNDLFEGKTFATYLPLFNVHAVFVPSNQSGLTDGRNRRDTVFGLYRSPAGSKRAIMPGNTSAIDSAIALAPATDYPIILANDDFYGGLGGQYAITTRSVESGQIVLRHELGHNFGNVGEEYDGGQVYTGANSSESSNVTWGHWLTAQNNSPVYESLFLSGEYLWQNLSTRSVRASFNFPRGDYRIGVIISSVGWSTANDVHVFLDGERVELQGVFTADRTFFDVVLNKSLSAGNHTLEVRENVRDGDNVLAFAQVYAHEAKLDPNSHEIAAYSTFDDFGNKAGYRPTFFSCIMRNMRSTDFCSVDIENMWIRFLDRVDLIDQVLVSGNDTQDRVVELQGAKLPGLNARWFRIDRGGREVELTEVAGQISWQARAGFPSGQYRVKVEYVTPEVRRPTSRFQSQKDFRI
jgi:hypothetical protein